MKAKTRTYTIREAAERCGFRRPNTFREKFLNRPEDRSALGAGYDHRGNLVLDRKAVDELVKRLDEEREHRGNWRVRNLGVRAQPGPRPRHSACPTGPDE